MYAVELLYIVKFSLDQKSNQWTSGDSGKYFLVYLLITLTHPVS